jgi:uncharacterized phage-associated protein
MNSVQEFDEKVALEAVLYLATESAAPTFHHIVKLLYFADRLHLKRYGRLIAGDRYIAMKHGPVPSAIYDMLKAMRDGVWQFSYPELDAAFAVEGNHRIVPQRPPDLEWLSESELRCMDDALRKYDRLSFHRLTQLSHDQAWKSADENDEISLEALVRSLDNAEGLLQHLKNPHP